VSGSDSFIALGHWFFRWANPLISLALSPISRYGLRAAWGSILGFLAAFRTGRDLGTGPQTGNVSVIHWLSRPGQFLQNG